MRRFIYISLFFLLLLPNMARAEILIILRQQAEASGNYVRVCDIARVEGPKELALEVAKTVLGPTPARGEVREITRWEIEHRIYEMGLETGVTFTGNETVRVTGNGRSSLGYEYSDDAGIEPSRQVGAFAAPERAVRAPDARREKAVVPAAPAAPRAETGTRETDSGSEQARSRLRNPMAALGDETREALTRAIADYLAKQYSRPDIDVEVRLASLSETVPSAVGAVTVEEALEGKIPGRASLAVRVVDFSGKENKIVAVGVDADVYALAPVASKPLYKGDILTPRDILVTRVKMKSGSTYLPPDAKAVEGREMQKAVQPGAPILATDAIPTAAVKRGATVAVDASGKGWRLQANAKALGAGEIGDIITVEDVSTKAKYQARITGYGKVAALPRKPNS